MDFAAIGFADHRQRNWFAGSEPGLGDGMMINIVFSIPAPNRKTITRPANQEIGKFAGCCCENHWHSTGETKLLLKFTGLVLYKKYNIASCFS